MEANRSIKKTGKGKRKKTEGPLTVDVVDVVGSRAAIGRDVGRGRGRALALLSGRRRRIVVVVVAVVVAEVVVVVVVDAAAAVAGGRRRRRRRRAALTAGEEQAAGRHGALRHRRDGREQRIVAAQVERQTVFGRGRARTYGVVGGGGGQSFQTPIDRFFFSQFRSPSSSPRNLSVQLSMADGMLYKLSTFSAHF